MAPTFGSVLSRPVYQSVHSARLIFSECVCACAVEIRVQKEKGKDCEGEEKKKDYEHVSGTKQK